MIKEEEEAFRNLALLQRNACKWYKQPKGVLEMKGVPDDHRPLPMSNTLWKSKNLCLSIFEWRPIWRCWNFERNKRRTKICEEMSFWLSTNGILPEVWLRFMFTIRKPAANPVNIVQKLSGVGDLREASRKKRPKLWAVLGYCIRTSAVYSFFVTFSAKIRCISVPNQRIRLI